MGKVVLVAPLVFITSDSISVGHQSVRIGDLQGGSYVNLNINGITANVPVQHYSSSTGGSIAHDPLYDAMKWYGVSKDSYTRTIGDYEIHHSWWSQREMHTWLDECEGMVFVQSCGDQFAGMWRLAFEDRMSGELFNARMLYPKEGHNIDILIPRARPSGVAPTQLTVENAVDRWCENNIKGNYERMNSTHHEGDKTLIRIFIRDLSEATLAQIYWAGIDLATL